MTKEKTTLQEAFNAILENQKAIINEIEATNRKTNEKITDLSNIIIGMNEMIENEISGTNSEGNDE